jgi:hypothetical protein
MRFVRLLTFAAGLGTLVALATPARAHRLDEYLQATRIGVGLDHVDLEIDLTAGVEVAPVVWRLVDTDGNGRISDDEGRKYAARVVGSTTLDVDGHSRAVTVVSSLFPSREALHGGSGTIRLEARAALPPLRAGRHTLRYSNTHGRAMSVYLVNALVPADTSISIASQRRDPRQTGIAITYDVAGAPRAHGPVAPPRAAASKP